MLSEPAPTECSWFAGYDPGLQCPEPIEAEDLCAAHLKCWEALIALSTPDEER